MSQFRRIGIFERAAQPLLAAILLLVCLLFAGHARAELLTVSANSALPDIGTVASGTSATPFDVRASDGLVSYGAGGGQFIPFNASRTSLTTITINCSGGNKCRNNNVTITITRGAATGRLSQITGFEAYLSGTTTARLASGTSPVSCTCTSMTFNILPIADSGNSGSKTFYLGVELNVNTSGTLGSATSGYTITASGTGFTTGSASPSVRANVQAKLGIQKASDLNFGRIVLYPAKSGSVTWDAANQTLSYNPVQVVDQIGSTSIGKFNVTGSPGQLISLSAGGNAGLPTKIRLTNQKGQTLDIAPSTTAQSSQTIPATGILPFYVGGTITISPGMNTGTYSGSFSITAIYQ